MAKMGGSEKHKEATGVSPAPMGDMGYSQYPVGNQGQPAAPEDEGSVAIGAQGRMDVFGSHEHFSDIQKGGVTGEEK